MTPGGDLGYSSVPVLSKRKSCGVSLLPQTPGSHKSRVLLARWYLPEACPGLNVPSYPVSWLVSLSCAGISLSVAFKAPFLWPLKSELESVWQGLVLAPPLLPARGRTKRTAIVRSINEPLSKQTPIEKGSLVTAACVSPTVGLISSQRALWGQEETISWWSFWAWRYTTPTAPFTHSTDLLATSATLIQWCLISVHNDGFGEECSLWGVIIILCVCAGETWRCSVTEFKDSLLQGRHRRKGKKWPWVFFSLYVPWTSLSSIAGRKVC